MWELCTRIRECVSPTHVDPITAIRRKDIEQLKLAHPYEIRDYEHSYGRGSLCEEAASRGSLECLKHLREVRRCAWGSATCTAAAEKGHLACLKYAHENGCPWDERTTHVAAYNRVNCFLYAYDNGCPVHKECMDEAACSGGLEIMQRLHKDGFPWTDKTTWWAARYGGAECLRYALTNGCPWSSRRAEGFWDFFRDDSVAVLRELGYHVPPRRPNPEGRLLAAMFAHTNAR